MSYSPKSGTIASIGFILFFLIAIVFSITLLFSGPRLKNKASENPNQPNPLGATMTGVNAKTQSLEVLKLLKTSQSSKSLTPLDDQRRILQQRKEAMLVLAKTNPIAFLRYAFPNSVRQKLTPSLQNLVEQENAQVDGIAQVVHGDNFKSKVTRTDYFLFDQSKSRKTIIFVQKPPTNFATGDTVKVSGISLDNLIVVPPTPDNEASNVKTVQQSTKRQKFTPKVAVILFNFADDNSTPWTPTQIKSWTFNDSDSVKAYFKKNSLGSVLLVGKNDPIGDVFGWVTIGANRGDSCNEYTWSQEANQILASQGVDLASYDHYIYAFPNANCWYAGLAEVSGSHLWINGSYEYSRHGVVNHELGHNFGADHANSYYCQNENHQQVAIGANCQSLEYGDPFDTMGDAWLNRELNAYHKVQLGYVQPKNILDISLSEGPAQTFFLAPLENKTSKVQILRIPRTKISSGVITQYYYLDFRQPSGVWDNFSTNDPVVNGVELRLGANLNVPKGIYLDDRPLLLDTQPQKNPSDYFSFLDSALPVSKRFVDHSRGVTFTTVSTSPSEAVVKVKYDKPNCIHAKPELTLYPIAQWGHPGETLYYNYSIKNNDNYGCKKSTFSLIFTTFSGWKAEGQTSGIVVDPENTFYGNFSLTSSTSTPPDSYYTFTMTTSRAKLPALNAAINANYNVYGAETTPPKVFITSPASGSTFTLGSKIIVKANATDNRRMSHVSLIIDGVEQPEHSFSGSSEYYLSWNTSKSTVGTHSLAARAYDLDGNNSISDQIEIVLQ